MDSDLDDGLVTDLVASVENKLNVTSMSSASSFENINSAEATQMDEADGDSTLPQHNEGTQLVSAGTSQNVSGEVQQEAPLSPAQDAPVAGPDPTLKNVDPDALQEATMLLKTASLNSDQEEQMLKAFKANSKLMATYIQNRRVSSFTRMQIKRK